MNIFPTSPTPAGMSREPFWNESAQHYDSGARQAGTPYVRPLYKYSISLSNIPRTKQRSLHAFWNQQRGQTIPFFFEDPYDHEVNATLCVRTGTNPTSFRVFTSDSFSVIPKSGSLRITSNLSGALTQGSHYILDQDTGIVVASMRPTSADFWTASCSYFKKVAFDQQYTEASQIWDSFSGQVIFKELL